MSVAKVAGTLYAILGLLAGAMFSLVAMFSASAGETGAALGALFGVGAIVFFPLFYGLVGFVMTLIMAALYNAIAGMVGGVEVDLQ